MSLKSIRESYSKLLTVFKDAGVKLSESQKSDLDTFVLALESKMSDQRREAIRQTKKAVEAKMEHEYRKVFESIMSGMRQNAVLSSKIQDKITKINEQKKLAAKVNDYLDLYIESVLPKKTIVDYDRMRRLERIHESLKEALVMQEDTVQDKVQELEKSYKSKKSKCETEVAKMQFKLNESMKKTRELKRQLEKFRARELLESKTRDLPSFEARRVKKLLEGASMDEIERKFKRVLESVKRHEKDDMESTVESEVKKVINGADVKEDDLLKNRPHNNHKSVEEAELSQDDMDEIAAITGNYYRASADDIQRGHSYSREQMKQANMQDRKVRKTNPEDFEIKEDDDELETVENVRFDDNGDVRLDESDVIDQNLMKIYCARAMEIE